MKPRLLFPLLCACLPLLAAETPIDFDKARTLHQRESRGEKLTSDEQEYLTRAKAEFAKRNGRPGQPSNATSANVPPKRAETGLVPLTDLTTPYQGEDGGLYGGGQNEPPAPLAAAANAATAKIQPLDAEGKPSPAGKIVLLSIGMSNTTQEYTAFMRVAANAKAENVVLVDGAQGGQTAAAIARAEAPFWAKVDERLKAAGVTRAQVQVAWLKQANAGPSEGFPGYAKKLTSDITADLQVARSRFPNLQLAYLSSRIYAGYATSRLNPEPYAYESAFSVRWLIQQQMKGEPALNADSAKGDVKAPLLLWGPYLWADGQKGRRTDDLVWLPTDLGPDGTHPSEAGRAKVAQLLLRFFQTDPLTRTWFAKK